MAATFQTSCAVEPTQPTSVKVTKTSRYFEMHPKDFARIPRLQEQLNFKNLDLTLLNAAIFHETNRRRVQKSIRSPLRYSDKLQDVAALQVQNNLERQKVSHQNTNPGQRALEDRFDFVGIRSSVWAENLAMVFGIKYESGTKFYHGNTNGIPTPRKTPEGPPIPPPHLPIVCLSCPKRLDGIPGTQK